MSQYGAYGLAKHGRDYRHILHHYYVHTKIGKAKSKSIKVLLTSGVSSTSFSGARKACGRGVSPAKSYRFAMSGSGVALLNAAGKKVKQCGGTGVAKSKKAISVPGQGTYRGELLAEAQSGTLYIVNRVGLQGYVQGVIPNEMPSSWAQQALRAQAVAARSYGLATAGGGAYDVYDDTRSQVYGGKGTETQATNSAAKHTAGEVVKHNGKVAVTYFFSTSGGHTENIEYSFVGASPVPYLKGVNDPYDKISPLHRWTVKLTRAQVASRLGGLFSGRLKKIHVLKRGTSPRIVYARVVGSAGSTKVTGATLRARLGLFDSWMSFGKHETGVPASGSGGGHHGGGGSGGGGGGIGPGKLRALVETGPAVQP
jgi:stage II sporulation protein D